MCNILPIVCLLCIFITDQVWGQRCPYGWLDRAGGDSCYKIAISNKYPWNDGRARCEQLQASFFKLESVQERDWLLRTLRNFTSVYPDATDWWSGVYTKGDNGVWLWEVDDTPIDTSLINWVDSVASSKKCSSVSGQGFNHTGCGQWKRVICERPKSLPLVCKSEGGWQFNNGSCIKFMLSKRTWDDASAYCHRYNSHLSNVLSWDAQRFLWDIAKEKKTNIWSGLRSFPQGNDVQWKWDNGTSLGTTNFWADDNPGTLSEIQRNSTCMEINSGLRRKMSWLATPCSTLKSFTCEKQQGVCQAGWLQFQESCFSFNPLYSLPWDQALAYCTGQGATLLKIVLASEQTFINLYLQEQAMAGIGSLWLGLSDNNKDTGPFQWGDGRPLKYSNWAPRNPNNTMGTQDCAYIDTNDATGRWQTSSDCTQLKSFACVIPVNQVVKPLTTPAPTYRCDSGWQVHGTDCFLFNDSDSTWPQAQQMCQAQPGSDLVVIRDSATQEFLNKHVVGGDYWIGLHDRSKEGNWMWVDNTKITKDSYTHWNKNEPNNMGNENCVAILGKWGADQNGKWNDYNCGKSFSFVCQKPAKNIDNLPNKPTPAATIAPIISKKCGAYWESSPGSDYCYQFNTEMLSWEDSRDMCKLRGGTLASITSVTEQFYIAGRIRHVNVLAMWTGANDRSSEGGWTWEDGSAFAYMNWVPGEPNDYGNSEDCGIIIPGTAKWNDFDCTKRNGYICKKLGNSPASTVPPSTSPATVPAGKVYGCQPGWRPYLNACYLVVSSKVTWHDAQKACRTSGGELTSVASEAENQFINSQIQKEKCVNIHTNDTQCEQWAETGECKKNPIWMANNCKDACALCEYVCADSHTQGECAAWARLGECAKNPDWMHVNCALSCGRCNTGTNQGVWTGFNDLQTPGSYVWSDDSPNSYSNWARNEPNNYQGKKENCVLMYTYGGKWNDDDCSSSSHGYVCKMPKAILATTQQSPFAVGCAKGNLGYQHYCYQFNNVPLSWQNAENTCKQRGGHLATVNSYIVQSFISAELTTRDDVYWIGLSDKAVPGTYVWSAGDKLMLTPWDASHTGKERSTCVAMRTTVPTGLWQNVQCDVIKPYICQLPRAGFTVPTTTPPPTTMTPLPCAPGWYGYQSLCYKAFRMGNADRKPWSEAMVYCQGLGGDLISIHSKAQEIFIENTLLKYFYNANFWIGLSDRAKEGSYKWSDGSPTDYVNWYRTEPNNSEGDEDCVEFNQFTKQWNDNNCALAKDWICQIARGATVPTTTIRTTTPVVSCAGTEKGWSYHDGACYYISQAYGQNSKMSWYDSRRYCMGEGGDLASIHGVDENNFITTLVTKRSTGTYWIGFNQLGGDDYTWTDGSASDYVRWKPGEPNDAFGGQLCVNLYGGANAGPGMWNDDNCMDINNFICKRTNGSFSTVTPAPTAPLTGGCPSGYTAFDNKCFTLGGLTAVDKLNWTDARDQCRKQGKQFDIASVNSYADQAFLITYMRQKGVTSPVWIGLNDRYVNGRYEWQDNTEVTYTYWNKGEPSDHYAYMRYNREDCVSMFATDGVNFGRWNDNKCSEKKSFLCQTFKSSTYPTPSSPKSSCKSGYQSFGTSCYRTVTSPTTWQGAQTACKADGGNLVSITDVYEQSFVDTVAHSNNILAAFWIGLSDKKTSGVYGWYDGWPVLYTRWGKEEPSRGTGEGCVSQMGLYWNDTVCAQNFPFVCEITSGTPPPTTPVPPGFCPDRTWVPHGQYCYLSAPNERKSWPEANFLCQEKGMQLVSVHSQEELQFLKQLLDTQTTTLRYHYYFNKPNVWLGLHKSHGGGFGWSDGSPAAYFNWNHGEPSDVNGTHNENCVEFYRDTLVWNDVTCFTDRSYICKVHKTMPSTIPPTTTTTTTTRITAGPTRRPGPGTTRPPSRHTPNPATGGPSHTQKIVNYPTHTPPHAVFSLPPGVHVDRIPHAHRAVAQGFTGGQIAGLVIGVLVCVVIVAVIMFVYRSRRPPPPTTPDSGFDNALYSKDSEDVTVANGTTANNVFKSGVPLEECDA